MTRPNIESPIVVTRNAARRYAALAALLVAPRGAGAGIVHIQVQKKNGVEYGAGYTVGRDKECFVVTPLHVVDLAPADSITVTDAKGSSAKARLLKGSQEFDAGLLQIVGDARLDCPADWSDGSAAVAAGDATRLRGCLFCDERPVVVLRRDGVRPPPRARLLTLWHFAVRGLGLNALDVGHQLLDVHAAESFK